MPRFGREKQHPNAGHEIDDHFAPCRGLERMTPSGRGKSAKKCSVIVRTASRKHERVDQQFRSRASSASEKCRMNVTAFTVQSRKKRIAVTSPGRRQTTNAPIEKMTNSNRNQTNDSHNGVSGLTRV